MTDTDARQFAVASLSKITFNTGDFASSTFDYGTLVILFSYTDNNDWQDLVTFRSGSGTGFTWGVEIAPYDQIWFSVDDAGGTHGQVIGSGNSYCLVITKPTGTATVRSHLYRYSTSDWNHADFDATKANGVDNITSIVAGEYPGGFDYNNSIVSAIAAYRHWVPNDATVEAAGFQTSLQNWSDKLGSGDKEVLWSFNQDSTATAITDLAGGGASQSAITDTSVATGPAAFDNSLATGAGASPAALSGVGTFGTPTISAVDGLRVKSVGALTASAAASAAVTLPTNASGDLILLCFTGRPAGNAGTADTVAATGYTQHPATINRREVGTQDLNQVFLYKVAGASESNPTVNVGTNYQSTATGWSCFAIVVAGEDSTNLFDTTTQVGGAAAAATFSGPNITTTVDGSLVINFVGSADDNALSMTTAQGFTSQASGSSYHTVTGGDHAAGLASKIQVTAGSVTAPTWTQTLVGNDIWAGITLAIRAVPTGTTVTPAALAGVGTFGTPTISASGRATPSAINGLGTFGAPTIKASALVSPGSLTGVSAFGAVTPTSTGRADPAALAGVGTFGQAVPSGPANVSVGSLSGVGTFGQVTAFGSTVVAPAVLQGTGTFGAPAPRASGTAAPASLLGVGTLGATTPRASGSVAPGALQGLGSFGQPTPKADSVVSGSLTGVGTFGIVIIKANANVTTGFVGVGTFGQVSINTTGAGTASPNALSGVGTFNAVVSTTGKVITSSLSGIGSFGQVFTTSDAFVSASLSGIGTFGQPTINTSGAGNVSPNALIGVGTLGTVTIKSVPSITIPALIGTGSFGQPVPSTGVTVQPAALPGIGTFGAPTIFTTGVVNPGALVGTGTFGTPSPFAAGAAKPNYVLGAPVIANRGDGITRNPPAALRTMDRSGKVLTIF